MRGRYWGAAMTGWSERTNNSRRLRAVWRGQPILCEPLVREGSAWGTTDISTRATCGAARRVSFSRHRCAYMQSIDASEHTHGSGGGEGLITACQRGRANGSMIWVRGTQYLAEGGCRQLLAVCRRVCALRWGWNVLVSPMTRGAETACQRNSEGHEGDNVSGPFGPR